MRFAKNTQRDTSKVLRLPRKMTMDTSKVLRLPRKLQHIFWKRRGSIAPATQNDFRHVPEHVWMSRSATPATRNEATRRLKPPKRTTSAKLPIGTAIRDRADGCGRLRTVATTNATSSEHTLNPQTPRVKREPLLRIREKGIGWRNASNAQETEGDNIATLRLRAIYVCKIDTCKNASNQVFKLHVTTGNKTSSWIGLVIQHLAIYVPVRRIFAHWFAYILGQRFVHWPSSRLESFSRKSANPSEVRRTLTQDRLSFIKGMWSTFWMMSNCVDWQFFF